MRKNQNTLSCTKTTPPNNCSRGGFCHLHNLNGNINIFVFQKKPSKVPLLKSRLEMKHNSKINKCFLVGDLNEIVNEALESMLKDVEIKIKNLNIYCKADNITNTAIYTVPSDNHLEPYIAIILRADRDLEGVADYRHYVYRNLRNYPVENNIKK